MSNFPPGINEGDIKVVADRTWMWDGDKWILKAEALDSDFTAVAPIDVTKSEGLVEYSFDIQLLDPLSGQAGGSS